MNTRAICLFLCIVAFSTIGASCNNLAGGSGVQYPPSWPIKELTVPPGATQIHVPGMGDDVSPLYYDGRLMNGGQLQNWEVAFSYTGDKNNIESHIEQCLKPLGYGRWMTQGRLRGWLTEDRQHQVQVEFTDTTKFGGMSPSNGGFVGYRLEIFAFTEPRPDIPKLEPIP